MKHITIFFVQAYNSVNSVTNQFEDYCELEVLAETEKSAIAKAKKYISKVHYRVSRVIEKEIL